MNIQSLGITKGMAAILIASLSLIACSENTPKNVLPVHVKREKVKDNGSERYTFNPRVDVLFVVDDSGSMETHQQNLAKNIDLFVKGLSNNQILDYHFGVLTSSMDGFSSGTKGGDGKLVGPVTVIDRGTPGGLAALRDNLQVGTSGSSQEVFFDPVKAALSAPLITNENKGFYRDDAHIAVIFITDADDQSDDLDPQTYYQFLLDLKKGDPKMVLQYGAYIPKADQQCSRSGESEPDRIEELMRIANGTTLGLCDLDFGQKLADLAVDLGNRVGRVMYLTRAADPSTIEVTFGNIPLPNDPDKGWVYDPARNAIIFGNGIVWESYPPGSTIEVNFLAAEYQP